ncbi:hypothetical protein VKT23_005591 [Stygiomarasmius scandens]|uniref:N-alpha-acetyltransferase 40 n=1 Tax=Marasmiellus scandens TaxID=2682957 RepID=A0ABR1JT72_9AGAR
MGVRLANKANSSEIQLKINGHLDAYRTTCYSAEELSNSLREKLWSIFEENMFELYTKSSFGWDPEQKRKELFDPLSRFIVLFSSGQVEQVAGFCMFRFEYEDGVDILYCYELQICSSWKRQNLGRYLMNSLSVIGTAWRMEKIMLTVFLANSEARSFYRAIGFTLDPSSPDAELEEVEAEGAAEDREEEEAVDYEILFKTC